MRVREREREGEKERMSINKPSRGSNYQEALSHFETSGGDSLIPATQKMALNNEEAMEWERQLKLERQRHEKTRRRLCILQQLIEPGGSLSKVFPDRLAWIWHLFFCFHHYSCYISMLNWPKSDVVNNHVSNTSVIQKIFI